MKNNFYDLLNISPLQNDRYRLLKSFRYKDVIVPKNYCTNGADIPRFLWSIWPPNRSNYLPAVVVHDYLCDLEQYDKADKYFKEMLEILEIDPVTIWCFYNFVRIYHRIRY